jgi:dCMP deaminase
MNKWQKHFKEVCKLTAELSHADKLKVGTIAVRDNRVICVGFNGTPPGDSNVCEEIAELKRNVKFSEWEELVKLDAGWKPSMDDVNVWERWTTKDNVIHAEDNLIRFARLNDISLTGCYAYITHNPCIECAKKLLEAKVAKVFYINYYKNSDGINYLLQRGTFVEQI